ncbi:alpha/beta hydrolase [Caenimonas terrae]|uniref:Alpha/beta hydrolase n=1 Tax=Caenimonas terrae TaxID=696074 RepID=A0ABW0NMW8_9BURK
MSRRLPWLAALASLLAAGACFGQAAQVVVDLRTRPGVKERMLVVEPGKPSAVLVLMAGGNGHIGIYDNGGLRSEGNFLVRSRALFVQRGAAVLLLDVPSDHDRPPYLSGEFRESDEHAADIGAAIAWARARWGLPVWLVGTSRGTQSAAYAATVLTGASAPDGLVLSSTILAEGRMPAARPVQEMALEKLRVPVLVLHHGEDQCPVTPPSLLPALMAKLPPATSRLITYQGGHASGAACDAFAFHGYNGIEDQVVADIAAFVAAHPR